MKQRMIYRLAAIAGVSVMLSAFPATAAMTDPLIEGAKLCTRHLPRYEREYGIPTHLLSAISSTESGRYHKGLKINIPWPWTINAGGKGYYYESKAEAIAAAKQMRRRGVKSMDVGCMQVNMMHHAQAFASLEEAFEPQHNIAYAASFLRSLYESGKSWKMAAAAYHSKTPSRGRQYVGAVYDHWYNIVSKLREAKLQAPAVTSFAQNTAQPPVMAPKPKKLAALPKQPAYKPVRMKSIAVSRNEDRRENGIIVVRPPIRVVDKPVAANASGAAGGVVTIAQVSPVSDTQVIYAENPAPIKDRTVTSGPRFIFGN